MGNYIAQSDLELALSPATVAQLSDDDHDGVADPNVIAQIIEQAEAEVDSFLLGYYPLPLSSGPSVDRLVKLAATDFGIYYLFRRHPEYVRTFGEDGRKTTVYTQAVSRMERIQEGSQALPDASKVAASATSGGFVTATGPRMMVDRPGDAPGAGSGDF